MSNQDKKRATHNSSTVASWFITLCQTFESYGLDVPVLIAQANLPAPMGLNPNNRIPVQKMQIIWEQAAQQSGDDAIGLKVAEFINPNTLNALGTSLWASNTIRQAWGRVLQYYRLISDVLDISVESKGDCTALCFNRVDGNPCAQEAIDAFMATAVKIAFDATGQRIRPVKVEFQRDPHNQRQAVTDYFKSDIRYRQSGNRLLYRNSDLDKPLLTANEPLAQHNDATIQSFINEITSPSVSDEVRRLLATELEFGELGKANIAKVMALSGRSLQRKLDQESSTYSGLLQEVRYTMARKYLADTNNSISGISSQLGFKDASNFSKAFKLWSGMPPKDYRASFSKL